MRCFITKSKAGHYWITVRNAAGFKKTLPTKFPDLASAKIAASKVTEAQSA
jgi:hypothetical protein